MLSSVKQYYVVLHTVLSVMQYHAMLSSVKKYYVMLLSVMQ